MWFLKALGIDYLKTESDEILKKQIDERIGELQRKEGELEAMAGRQSEEEHATLQASVKKFQAAIAEHGKERDRRRKEREELERQQKVLAEKKILCNRLLQQQQNLTKEREADEAQAKKLEAQLALIAEEQAEYDRLRPMAASHEKVQNNLNGLRKKREEFLQLNRDLLYVKDRIADFTVRADKQRGMITSLDADVQKRTELITKIRTGLGAGKIAEDRLDGAVNLPARRNQQTGRYTLRKAGAVQRGAGEDYSRPEYHPRCRSRRGLPALPSKTRGAFREHRSGVQCTAAGSRRKGNRRSRTAGKTC